MTKTELLALAEQIDAIGWCSADEAKPLNAMSALARKLAALEPVAFVIGDREGKAHRLYFNEPLDSELARWNSGAMGWEGYKPFRVVATYNLTGIIDHE